jgi:uncharacterized protein YcnI
MRCSGWSSLAISVCSALLLAGPAAAHVVAIPTYLPSKSSGSITFEVPNERAAPMTGFAVTAPPGLVIHHANPVADWAGVADGTSAKWTGGSLPPKQMVRFTIALKADVDPGLVQLDANQLYDDGSVVSWPVQITVVPAAESPRQNLALAGVVALIGVLAVVAIAMLAWRRKARPLQEK